MQFLARCIRLPQAAFGISSGDSLSVSVEGSEIRLRKVEIVRPLDDADPIWRLIGSGERGETDTSEKYDQHLAAGEVKRWER